MILKVKGSACVPDTHQYPPQHDKAELHGLIFLPLQAVPPWTWFTSPLPSLAHVFVLFAYTRLILLMGSLIKCAEGAQLKGGIDKQSPWLSACVNWISTYLQRTRMLSIFFPIAKWYNALFNYLSRSYLEPGENPLHTSGPAEFQQILRVEESFSRSEVQVSTSCVTERKLYREKVVQRQSIKYLICAICPLISHYTETTGVFGRRIAFCWENLDFSIHMDSPRVTTHPPQRSCLSSKPFNDSGAPRW